MIVQSATLDDDLMVEWMNVVFLVFVDELIQAGWSKCWSKRENRPYYFNRFTNQSLWEMPVLGQHDVIVSAAPFASKPISITVDQVN